MARARWTMVLLTACAAASPGGAPVRERAVHAPLRNELERFLPLRDGDVLSYWVYVGRGAGREQAIFQVERRDAEHASLRSGNDARELVLGPDGIRRATGGYLLRAPLVPGAEWDGPLGRVQLVAVDRSIEVSAGHFTGCVETRETMHSDAGPRSISTVYCPDVGITSIDVVGGERFELRSYGRRVDLDAL